MGTQRLQHSCIDFRTMHSPTCHSLPAPCPPRTVPQALWLVQPPALLEASSTAAYSSPAPKQPDTTAAPATLRAAATPLAALRRGLRRLASGLRRRLAAAACMARPATLECGGCPGRRRAMRPAARRPSGPWCTSTGARP